MRFSPIAIVGQGCVLPGAHSPEHLWQTVLNAQRHLGSPSEGYWGVSASLVSQQDPSSDHTWSDQGGYVKGFDEQWATLAQDPKFKPFGQDDDLFRWSLYAAHQALQSAGFSNDLGHTRAGVILGNLSYPTPRMSDTAVKVWQGQQLNEVDAMQRFMSGASAHAVANTFNMRAGSFSLDAACASSLYAIKLACDRLQDNQVDVMLAGGVNHADDLFIHIGFCALKAMSKTGQSRPFHADADGLVPAEGAGFVTLMRLKDAAEQGRPILGVIRGVGLSNDGRGRGLLSPSEDGQFRAMQQAYDQSGLTPQDISLVECHATGTPLGDATELRSMSRVFEGTTGIPVGSLKANMGHLITASGVAGLMKVLASMKHQMLPPVIGVDDPSDALTSSPFELLTRAKDWESNGPRRGAVNNFGFGGNNAHLLVEEWTDVDQGYVSGVTTVPDTVDEDIAIVGIAATIGEHQDVHATFQRLIEGDMLQSREVQHMDFDLKALRFPPNDLKQTLPQQLLALKSSFDLNDQIQALPQATTGIFTGMQCDAEITRHGARWRLTDHMQGDALKEARARIVSGLKSAGVLGTMPNIVANRLNSQFDLMGPSFTVSSEELSGTMALRVAARALRHGQLDAALVNAVDLSCEAVHQACAKVLFSDRRQLPADAAVTLILKRASDARRDQDTIYAVLPAHPMEHVTRTERFDEDHGVWDAQTGHAHAASGLLQVALGALCLHHGVTPPTRTARSAPWMPHHGVRSLQLDLKSFTHQTQTVQMASSPSSASRGIASGWELRVYGAHDRDALISAVESGARSDEGTWRASMIVKQDQDCADITRALVDAIRATDLCSLSISCTQVTGHEAWFGHGARSGDVALVFTGPAGAYPGMGRSLLTAIPSLVDGVALQFNEMPDAVGWVYDPDARATHSDRLPVDKLWGSSFLCQAHAQWTRGVLGIKPDATIGFCSGETNAAFAMQAWDSLDDMREEIDQRGVFDRVLGGDFQCLTQSWGEAQPWESWRVLASVEEVEAAIGDESRAHLTIVSAPGDVVLAGEASACARVIARLGEGRAKPLGYNIVMHCPEARAFEEPWYALHHRPTREVDGVRFYTNAGLRAYEASADHIAQALTGQAMNRVDFPALVERAWEDGVRVFIEHGPHAGCTQWIDKTLGERPHTAIALDRYGADALQQALRAAAHLHALGVPIHSNQVNALLSDAPSPVESKPATKRSMVMSFDGHWPQVVYPSHLPAIQTPSPHEASALKRPIAPAHLPTPSPTLEVDVMSSEPTNPSPQRMAAPPRLPSSSTRGQAPSAPSPGVTQPAPAAQAPAPKPRAGASAPSVALAPVATQLSAGHASEMFAQISVAHEEFLAQQAQLQAKFLEHTQQVMNALFTGHSEPQIQTQTRPPAPAQQLAQTAPRSTPAPAQQVTRAPVAAKPKPAPVAVTAPIAPTPRPVMPSVVKAAPVAPVKTQRKKKESRDQFVPTNKRAPVGPTFDRDALNIHASGNISEIFGDVFVQQDAYPVQVRMPEPPLLLCDRVTGIDAEPAKMSTGTMWTETDVREDSWYLHQGRMPTGIMIESGQADLMLVSWMGADFLNKGERSYRLLGCDLRFHGPLPTPGETLVYDIHIDGHAKQNDVRLFFFHYDCSINGSVRLSVRGGQAGFFTREELDDSNGILWTPEGETPEPARVDVGLVADVPKQYDRQSIESFAAGRTWETFGDGFSITKTHTRTPRIQTERMLFLDEIEVLDHQGGPWGRGYLRAVQHINPNIWFFDGHFKNDPCMPGTLMFEGCVQTMAFYMASLGMTLDNDGWVFEPVPDLTYKLRCRGQVTPDAKHLTYEVFVKEVHNGAEPVLYADILCTIDGLKAFHCGRMGLKLSPAWILDRQTDVLKTYEEPKPVAKVDGFAFGYDSLLACAWGKPSRAFGPRYDRFDSARRVARLPGPPYHFISRVTHVDEPMAAMKAGVNLEVEYDVSPDEWYFKENGSAVMPYAVLLEAGLQPCGWLASYVGCALSKDIDLYFRNLDGTATQYIDVTPQTGTLGSKVVLKSLAQAAGTIIVSFDVQMRAIDLEGQPLVFTMDTVFGFFPKAALAQQAGIESSDEFKRWVLHEQTNQLWDLTKTPAPFFNTTAKLANPKMLMLDRVTGYWPEGGEAGLGRIRAEKDVDATAWFFKAHFFQDPVQPGSLGIEALLQLLQSFMLLKGLHEEFDAPRFEAIANGAALSWKYRGQVLPKNALISSSLEVTSIERDEAGVVVTGDASLWVDGMRIYSTEHIAMRIVEGGIETRPFDQTQDDGASATAPQAPLLADQQDKTPYPQSWERMFSLDLERSPWLNDHKPTYTAAALPMMSILDELAKACVFANPDLRVTKIRGVELKRWVIVDEPRQLKVQVLPDGAPHTFDATLSMWWDAPRESMSRWEEVATATVTMAPSYKKPPVYALPALEDPEVMPNPYTTGVLFHGPAFHVIDAHSQGSNGADGTLKVHRSTVPTGVLHPVLLDGALQIIPHDGLGRWFDELSANDTIAYPYAVESFEVYGPSPSHGVLQSHVRALEVVDGRFVRLDVQVRHHGKVWCHMILTEVLFPKGRLGAAAPAKRRAFLRDATYQDGVALSSLDGHTARLSTQELQASEWFKGTIEAAYNVGGALEQRAALVCIKDATGRALQEHPRMLHVQEDVRTVTSARLPWLSCRYDLNMPKTRTFEVHAHAPTFDRQPLSEYWKQALGVDESWPGLDVYEGFTSSFVRKIILDDPEDFAQWSGKPVMYLGNHQVQIESLLVTAIASCLGENPVITMANAKHEAGWVGQLIRELFGAPGAHDPGNIVYFDQSNPGSMISLLDGLKERVRTQQQSIMVHAPGTRARHNQEEVHKVSSLFLDMAIELDIPIIPVSFGAGLPDYTIEKKLEFPVGYGKQDYIFGRALTPTLLEQTPYAKRRALVLDAINALGRPYLGQTCEPNEALSAMVQAHQTRGMNEVNAVILAVLKSITDPRPTTQRSFDALQGTDSGAQGPLGEWIEQWNKRFDLD